MKYTNSELIQSFGDHNASMNDNQSYAREDPRVGELQTYLDLSLLKHWALPLFAIRHVKDISILDVGAGTGRITKHLCKIAGKCVAIEPYSPFFNKLKSSCIQSNVEVHQCTLKEYAETMTQSFDLIVISGVLSYNNDEEALEALRIIYNLLRPTGLVFIRDYGVEQDGAGDPPFGSIIRYASSPQIVRPPEGIREIARRTGLSYIRWRRSYPLSPMRRLPAIDYRWPNFATRLFLKISYSKWLYPAWGVLAAMNLRYGKEKINYFSYLLQKN